MPLISALHSHVQHADRCGEGHGDTGTTDPSDCNFCALYAQFVPREAPEAPSFSFRSPVTPLLTVFVQPKSKARADGLVTGYINRGPPAVFG